MQRRRDAETQRRRDAATQICIHYCSPEKVHVEGGDGDGGVHIKQRGDGEDDQNLGRPWARGHMRPAVHRGSDAALLFKSLELRPCAARPAAPSSLASLGPSPAAAPAAARRGKEVRAGVRTAASTLVTAPCAGPRRRKKACLR